MDPLNFFKSNRKSWNEKTPIHVASAFYDVPAFLNGKTTLNDIELNLLGNVAGKSVLHLQCHFGLDTLSLARMGAKVTGVDFSEAAVAQAQKLTKDLGLDARFICCDIYDLPSQLDQEFDIVYTSYGTISWLPDLTKWAQIITRNLAAGGKFVFAEFHPIIWAYDDHFKNVTYGYFNSGPIIETEQGTYADKNASVTQESVTWNHSLSEVFTALLASGLVIKSFDEFDYSPYPCFQHVIEIAPGRWVIEGWEHKMPLVYSLCAMKK